MKKLVCVLLSLLLLSTAVFAANGEVTPRYANAQDCTPTLKDSGGGVKVGIFVRAFNATAAITAELTLKKTRVGAPETEVDSWAASGVGVLDFSDVYSPATSGTYTLYVTVTVGSEVIEQQLSLTK